MRSSSPFVPALLLAASLLLGCGDSDQDSRPYAVGKEGEILVLIDSTRWNGVVGDALRNELGRYIQTLPQPERAFQLRVMPISVQFEQLRKQKNIVIAAVLTDSTDEAAYIRSRLGEGVQDALAEGGRALARGDLWRRQQMVWYLFANTPEALAETIRERGEDLRYSFDLATRERMTLDMFERGRQRDIEAYLMENHHFAVNVQHDYVVARDTSNFIWLRRLLTDTWRDFFVYYIEDADPSVLSPEWILATRDSLTRQHIRGSSNGYVQADQRAVAGLEAEEIDFLGRYGFETRGLWILIDGYREDGSPILVGGGGPFVNYTFYDEGSGRIYMIDGGVFAPGFEKREFLRQMEVIAHTFRTRAEEQGAQTVAANEPPVFKD